MLVLTRRQDQSILIDGGIRVTVVSIRGGSVRIGIEAPSSVRIDREEVRTANTTWVDVQTDALPALAATVS